MIQVVQYRESVAADHLTGRRKSYYDSLGREYKSEIYAVDPTDGSVGHALVGETCMTRTGASSRRRPRAGKRPRSSSTTGSGPGGALSCERWGALELVVELERQLVGRSSSSSFSSSSSGSSSSSFSSSSSGSSSFVVGLQRFVVGLQRFVVGLQRFVVLVQRFVVLQCVVRFQQFVVRFIVPSSSGPVPLPAAYYEANEPASCKFERFGRLHGLLRSGLPACVAGKCGGARHLGAAYFQGSATLFNPGTASPIAFSIWFKAGAGVDANLASIANEYELLLCGSSTLTFRIATSGSSGWDKTVTVPWRLRRPLRADGITRSYWITPGSQIGLQCDGGAPDTETLSSGQSAYTGGGANFVLGSSVTSTGVDVDEMALFYQALDGIRAENLWNGGAGLFYRDGQWGTCPSGSSSSSSSSSSSAGSSSSSSASSASALVVEFLVVLVLVVVLEFLVLVQFEFQLHPRRHRRLRM